MLGGVSKMMADKFFAKMSELLQSNCMKPASFEYVRPATLADALEVLHQRGDDAKVLAGGQSLVPMMNFRLARPAVIVDLNGLPELAYIRVAGDGVALGAMTRQRTIEKSSLVRERSPLARARRRR